MDELEFCTDLDELTAREQVAHLKTTRAMHRLMEQQFILDLEEERRLGFSHSHNDEFNWDAFHAWQEKSDVE